MHREVGVDLLRVVVVVAMAMAMVILAAARDQERGRGPGGRKRKDDYQALQGHKQKVTFGTKTGRMKVSIIIMSIDI